MTQTRKGFSLIEVMVAMTMFAVVMLGIAKTATAVAVRGRTNDVTAKRTATLLREANKLGAVPFANLATWPTTPDTLSRDNFRYARRVVITPIGMTRYTVKIVVTPTADVSKKDSIVVERSKPAMGSPLCVGC